MVSAHTRTHTHTHSHRHTDTDTHRNTHTHTYIYIYIYIISANITKIASQNFIEWDDHQPLKEDKTNSRLTSVASSILTRIFLFIPNSRSLNSCGINGNTHTHTQIHTHTHTYTDTPLSLSQDISFKHTHTHTHIHIYINIHTCRHGFLRVRNFTLAKPGELILPDYRRWFWQG